MSNVLLIEPRADHESLFNDYREEHINNGEDELIACAGFEKMDYGTWLKKICQDRQKETVSTGKVPYQIYFIFNSHQTQLLGVLQLRMELNEYLASYGGHIGLGLRPSARGKGYASSALVQALNYYNDSGISEILLVCKPQNLSSRKLIERNGGVFVRCVMDGEELLMQYTVKID